MHRRKYLVLALAVCAFAFAAFQGRAQSPQSDTPAPKAQAVSASAPSQAGNQGNQGNQGAQGNQGSPGGLNQPGYNPDQDKGKAPQKDCSKGSMRCVDAGVRWHSAIRNADRRAADKRKKGGK